MKADAALWECIGSRWARALGLASFNDTANLRAWNGESSPIKPPYISHSRCPNSM